jgi:hypothetical protein
MHKTTQEQLTIAQTLELLKKETINTWFDLGLFIDRFKDEVSNSGFEGDFGDYISQIDSKGIGFISFHFTVDGITVEVEKYATIFKGIFPNAKIHYIAGEIHQEANEMIDDAAIKKEIPEMQGFDKWPLYKDFFKIRMQRGSKEYNQLIGDFWQEVLVLTDKLGTYIEENDIKLLYLINVCSNPGNVSLALASVLISEYLGIPVINNSHDFYWEGGHRQVEIERKNLDKGPRDFFFHNAHVGEFFSIIEVLYPWNSRSWMNVNINTIQRKHLIRANGLNPANVEQIGTAIDEKLYKPMSKRDTIRAFKQVASIFANNKQTITVHKADRHLESDRALSPILFGSELIRNFDFVNNNIVFLQPTRVISRKNIETNFKLVRKLFENKEFIEKFVDNPQLNLSLIVTGPIPSGQKDYYRNLLSDFSGFLGLLEPQFRSRVFLGFLFSEFDKYEFRKKYDSPIDIKQLYNVASLILLPSQTEGRGLPIIEAAASATPIFCRQYEPREVFEEVIGYHLSAENRLRVLEFKGSRIPDKLISKIINHVFYPQNSLDDVAHNLNVIKKRYSLQSLGLNVEYIIYKHYLQLNSISRQNKCTPKLIEKYNKLCQFKNEDLDAILNTKTRHYLPGYNRYGFMIYLKSLIDPSFFRVEEQFNRSEILSYAEYIESYLDGHTHADIEDIHNFYNCVEDIFEYEKGQINIRHDHSLAYRHRNTRHFPYRDYTYQELTGLVNMIYFEVFKPKPHVNKFLSPQFFTDWKLALFQLTNSRSLGIDDRDILTEKLKTNVPKGFFSGRYINHELEYFVLQPVRALLNLKIEEELSIEHLKNSPIDLQKVYVFIHEPSVTEWFSNNEIEEYLRSGIEPELSLLFEEGIIQTVITHQWTNGVHFPQMGADALKVLRQIKEQNGFIITNGEYSAMMTDIIDIDHFHIGKAEKKMTAKIMGIPQNAGFIQYVPAGLRTTLAYPTPIQNAKEFNEVLKGDDFKHLKEQMGEKVLLKALKKDAEENGSPLKLVIENLKNELNNTIEKNPVKASYIGGVYDDGLPWSGVTAEINTKGMHWNFAAYFATDEPKNVPTLIEQYKKENKVDKHINFAWNGGYILNPELVGKLALPETYIGSPLGLLIMDGQIKSMPLFNKPAFIIYKDGRVDIQRVNLRKGFKINTAKGDILFDKQAHNVSIAGQASYYDLEVDNNHIATEGNVVIRVAGNTIKEIIETKPGDMVNIIPVGVTLLIPPKDFDKTIFALEQALNFEIEDEADIKWSDISYAIEAGPSLIVDNKVDVDMEIEGWKTTNSIKTQAARLDFTDMRGPKIAVGINSEGKLLVLMVNGRIRESVGATHFDMAEILKSKGIEKAMGFDPGGSSTLVIDDEVMNISPYNKEYEHDIFSLPPESRFVSNIIMGWIEE